MSRSESSPNHRPRHGGSPCSTGKPPNGFVTAETAVALPVLLLLTALLITGIAAGAAQIRCVDAAAAGARALARGEPAEVAHARALAAAPAGAHGEAWTGEGLVRFRVTARVSPPGTMWAGVGFHVEHVAIAAVEEFTSTEPTTPDEPAEPTTPTEPTEPTTPDEPNTPTEPTTPHEPTEPNTPRPHDPAPPS